jgi:hypothetical protein
MEDLKTRQKEQEARENFTVRRYTFLGKYY